MTAGYTGGSAARGGGERAVAVGSSTPSPPPPAPLQLHDRVELHLSNCTSAATHRTVGGEVVEQLPDGSWLVRLDEPAEPFDSEYVQGPGFRREGECPHARAVEQGEAAA
jgi:hypothetical protein